MIAGHEVPVIRYATVRGLSRVEDAGIEFLDHGSAGVRIKPKGSRKLAAYREIVLAAMQEMCWHLFTWGTAVRSGARCRPC
jgi:hypothetical protein